MNKTKSKTQRNLMLLFSVPMLFMVLLVVALVNDYMQNKSFILFGLLGLLMYLILLGKRMAYCLSKKDEDIEYLRNKVNKYKQEKEDIQKVNYKNLKLISLGEMISNIIHQWRQPLNVINGIASGIKLTNQNGAYTIEEINNFMTDIMTNVTHMSETITTFREFIKEDSEMMVLEVKEDIEKTLLLTSHIIEDNNIELITNLEEVKPFKVKMVSCVLSQVIINIMNNAKDVLKDRRIDNPRIELNVKRDENVFSISIRDNAGGIDEGILPKVFDPYFTTKSFDKGTGIGLSMSKKLVEEKLRGKISVSNKKNGAEFLVEVPVE